MEEIREATDLGSRQEIVLIVLDMLVLLAPGLVSDKGILFDEVELISIFSQQFYQKFFHHSFRPRNILKVANPSRLRLIESILMNDTSRKI